MDKHFSTQETYVKEFNPNDYFDTYYDPKNGAITGEWLSFVLKNLHETFTTGGVKGDTLIDIGAGPTIYHLLSACGVFKNIITSDFLPQNIAELQKWLQKDPSALDWSAVVKRVCELEGDSENWERKEEKLRGTVNKVLKCDVLKKNPFEPHVLPPADCLMSLLCFEAACKDKETFCDALKNVKDLIKPGGHLLLLSMLNSTFYYIGKKKFYCLAIDQESVEKACKEAGYEIEKMVVTPREEKTALDLCGHNSHYYVLARKPHIQ